MEIQKAAFESKNGIYWQDIINQFWDGLPFTPESTTIAPIVRDDNGREKPNTAACFSSSNGDELMPKILEHMENNGLDDTSKFTESVWDIRAFPFPDYKRSTEHPSIGRRFRFFAEPIQLQTTSGAGTKLEFKAQQPAPTFGQSPIVDIGEMIQAIFVEARQSVRQGLELQEMTASMLSTMAREYREEMKEFALEIRKINTGNPELEQLKLMREIQQEEDIATAAIQLQRDDRKSQTIENAIVRVAGPLLEKHPEIAMKAVEVAGPTIIPLMEGMVKK